MGCDGVECGRMVVPGCEDGDGGDAGEHGFEVEFGVLDGEEQVEPVAVVGEPWVVFLEEGAEFVGVEFDEVGEVVGGDGEVGEEGEELVGGFLGVGEDGRVLEWCGCGHEVVRVSMRLRRRLWRWVRMRARRWCLR